MGMAAMSPSQEALCALFTTTPRIIGGRQVADAVDPVVRREMEDSAIAEAGRGNGTLNHLLGAVCGELKVTTARPAITAVLVKANSE